MISTCLLRPLFLWPDAAAVARILAQVLAQVLARFKVWSMAGSMVMTLTLIGAWPAQAGSVPTGQTPAGSLMDRYSSSPRRQYHSRTGARVEIRVPGVVPGIVPDGVINPVTPPDDDVLVAPRVNVNSASAEELAASLPGIGPSKARGIVEWREAHGPFQTIDQLLEVSGIGPATLDNIRPFVLLSDSLSLGGRAGKVSSPDSTQVSTQLVTQITAQEKAVVAALGTIIRQVEQDRRLAMPAAGAIND